MRLSFYSDPGHGWLAVPLELLDRLQLLDRVSHYSYLRGRLAHLEEDCDASLFLAAPARWAGLLPGLLLVAHPRILLHIGDDHALALQCGPVEGVLGDADGLHVAPDLGEHGDD